MKPAAFDYVRPTTIAEAVSNLAQADGEGKVLAGGQSLIPLLNFRLAAPRVLVDLNRIAELSYIRLTEDAIFVGAMTRTRNLERDQALRAAVPLISELTSWIGHVQIRNRGTVGGSIAHADPAAELPALALALDGTLVVAGRQETRSIPANEAFLGFLTTTLEEDEILTEVQLRRPPATAGWGFQEFAPRHGDFALAGAIAVLTPGLNGEVSEARIVAFGGPDAAIRASGAEQALIGSALSDGAIDEAATVAAVECLQGDPRADAAYRQQITKAMIARALRDAASRIQA